MGNRPGATARTATQALTKVTYRYSHAAVAAAFGTTAVTPESVLPLDL